MTQLQTYGVSLAMYGITHESTTSTLVSNQLCPWS